MENDRLTLAAILALVRATLTLLLASLVSRLAPQAGFGPKLITAMLTLISFLLFAYIFTTFRRLLAERCRFHGGDLFIAGLIGLNGLAAVLTLGGLFAPGLADTFALKLVSVAFGLLLSGFALQLLLRLDDPLFGLRKLYAGLLTVAGLGIASLKLAGVGVIFGAVADILLAVIFVRAGSRTADPSAT
ncbi:hypothetical protein MIT9_P2219 [Methylomarinovum caldicuralii]|uniref:Uncharacterized protein n=1 Tax=Methylomarinovum caldicuralii TaxID=438856 RepID=A0AAU9C4F3_9GAMM|nr:hypothetical protein [Methylomarinovum caldicuralii]BCX82633.1 hypothetical protein MIT9_P2219 [Methylomarinovum caldicuralii]